MASKQVFVKEYKVRAHWRTIQTRVFQFVCKKCDRLIERETFAVKCPKYCEQCRPVSLKSESKSKKPTLTLVERAISRQSHGTTDQTSA